jgi:hypothetical protein
MPLACGSAYQFARRWPILPGSSTASVVAAHAAAGSDSQLGAGSCSRTSTGRRCDVLLEAKNAVIYGGGGPIGGAVARAFAPEGARVFLAGRTPARLEGVGAEIRSAGGAVETAQVDALDAKCGR